MCYNNWLSIGKVIRSHFTKLCIYQNSKLKENSTREKHGKFYCFDMDKTFPSKVESTEIMKERRHFATKELKLTIKDTIKYKWPKKRKAK